MTTRLRRSAQPPVSAPAASAGTRSRSTRHQITSTRARVKGAVITRSQLATRKPRQRKPRTTYSPSDDTAPSRRPRQRTEAVDARPLQELHPDEQCQRQAAKVRSQMKQLRYLQAYVEAYEAEGWRRASREKLKPSHELRSARQKIRQIKEVTVAALQEIMALRERDPQIPYLIELEAQPDDDDVAIVETQGTDNVHAQHIYCCRCSEGATLEHNDILLCDSEGCCRAFHQQCQVPAVKTEDIPEGDDPWYCASCEALFTALKVINNACESEYETAADVFPELRDPKQTSISGESDQDEEMAMMGSGESESDDEFMVDADAIERESSSDGSTNESDVGESGDDHVIESDVSDGELAYLDSHDILDANSRSTRSREPRNKGAPQDHIGQQIGKLDARGDKIYGVVLDCSSSDGPSKIWRVVFHDGTVESLNEEALRAAMELAPSEASDSDASEVDHSLVIHGKRKRARVDYQALNALMFDGQADSDVDDDDSGRESDSGDSDAAPVVKRATQKQEEPAASESVGCAPKRSRRQRREIDYQLLHEGLAN